MSPTPASSTPTRARTSSSCATPCTSDRRVWTGLGMVF
jgi:hypothetical protein